MHCIYILYTHTHLWKRLVKAASMKLQYFLSRQVDWSSRTSCTPANLNLPLPYISLRQTKKKLRFFEEFWWWLRKFVAGSHNFFEVGLKFWGWEMRFIGSHDSSVYCRVVCVTWHSMTIKGNDLYKHPITLHTAHTHTVTHTYDIIHIQKPTKCPA